MEMSIEPPEFLNEPSFDSKLPIPWKEIKEGNTIRHKEIIYEVAFKSVRKRAVDGYLIESNQILYLRPISQGENVIGMIDSDNQFSFMLASFKKNIGTGEVAPHTSSFHESWTEEYLDSLKAELKRKIDKIRSRLNDQT